MKLNKSESLTTKLLGNTFLNMYVSNNPQIKVEGEKSAVELCDVLISFHGMAILVEVKEFNEEIGHSKPDDWLNSRVFFTARKQLTRSCNGLIKRHVVFDKITKETISTKNWESIMTVVVFDRDDVENYSYIRAVPDDDRFCGVNIFSMKDFRLVIDKIPTPLDLFKYLEKRYWQMIQGNHLYPMVYTPKEMIVLKKANITDEMILIYDYVFNNTKNYDGNIGPAKSIIKSGKLLYEQKADETLLHALSLIDMNIAQEIDEMYKDLVNRTNDNELMWNSLFIKSSYGDGKIGFIVVYSKTLETALLNFDKLKEKAVIEAKNYGIETIFAMVFYAKNVFTIKNI